MKASIEEQNNKPSILHVCKRDMLRPLRDQILRVNGYHVDSTLNVTEALRLYSEGHYRVVLIDVEGEQGIEEAEKFCSNIRSLNPDQIIAFVCNWRVAITSDCPTDIVRTEFDPAAFVEGVQGLLEKH